MEWAKQSGIHFDYVMRPVIADVIFKKPSEFAKLVDRIGALAEAGVPRALAIEQEISMEAECPARGGSSSAIPTKERK
jgi:hypothetical protein